MKLTSHQKRIVDAIISKQVYDIRSYFEYFGKSHKCKYDFEQIKSVFEMNENGRTYMFRKGDDSYFYTDTYDCLGNLCNTRRVANLTTHELHDRPISVPVKATLSQKAIVESFEYNGVKFIFDFLKKGYPVADSFEDIVDFITLWSYLKREALILEVDKPISEDDISVFFELEEQTINPNSNPYWSRHFEILSEETESEPAEIIYELLPEKDPQHYIRQAWKLNEENLLTCSEFIGKKIIASSELRIYKQKKYKTTEEIFNLRNLIVAWVAVGISVVSVFLGNVLPIFKPQETDYLSLISERIATIEEFKENDPTEELLLVLQRISVTLDALSQHQYSEDYSTILEKLELQLEELNGYLAE